MTTTTPPLISSSRQRAKSDDPESTGKPKGDRGPPLPQAPNIATSSTPAKAASSATTTAQQQQQQQTPRPTASLTQPRGPGGRTAPETAPRGRGRPPGGSRPVDTAASPAVISSNNNASSINSLLQASKILTCEKKYAKFLKGEMEMQREQEKSATGGGSSNSNNGGKSNHHRVNLPPSNQVPTTQTTQQTWKHPALDDDNSLDSEYARFVRGLVDDDDFTFKTLNTIKDAAMPSSAANDVVGTIVGDDVACSVLDNSALDDGDDEDYQLTSDEEEEEEEEEDKSQKSGNGGIIVYDTPSRGKDDNNFDLDNHLFGEIEGLLEEDLDAQLTSLMQMEILNENRSKKHSVDHTAHHHVVSGKIAVAGSEQQKAITSPGQSTKKKKSTQTVVTTPTFLSPETALPCATAQVTRRQLTRLRETMAKHHQLLLQQATLAVRAAYVQKWSKEVVSRPQIHRNPASTGALPPSALNSRQLTFCASGPMGRECSYEMDFFHGENAEELAECLDGAVGMLQDLEQNWKDAVRSSIQLSYSGKSATACSTQHGGRRNLMSAISEKSEVAPDAVMQDTNNSQESNNSSDRRLTRSALTRTLLEREQGMAGLLNDGESSMLPSGVDAVKRRISVFDIRGLARLRETFSAIDSSVKEVRREESREENGNETLNILLPTDHGDACELLLKHAGAEVNETLVPGRVDLSELFTHAPEAFTEPDKVGSILTKAQQKELRKNKNQYTTGEDNLILRGVNLYGEKEWVLVSDRFLPDRAVNSISQRYHRLCFLIYKSNGIFIDDEGKLAPLPTFKKGSLIAEDEAALRTQEAIAKIKPPAPPSTMNVHRWTIEEDVAILKAVPMMGNQWAEITHHILPHRDRGHIRKRYQVLERRIPKGTMRINIKRPATGELGRVATKYAKTAVMPKPQLKPQPKPQPPKKKEPRKANGNKSRAKPTKATTNLPVTSIQSNVTKMSSSYGVTIDEDDEKGAALLHKLSTPQRLRQENKHLSQECDAARDLAYILNGQDNSNTGGETTRMGLEKILENNWSQQSGMQRFLDAKLADESKPNYSPIKSNHLSNVAAGDADSSRLSMMNDFNAAEEDQHRRTSNQGARRSLLSSAMQKTVENASKRKRTEAPPERSVKVSGSPVKVNLGSYVSSPNQSPTSNNIFTEEPFSLAAAYGHLTPQIVRAPVKVDTPGVEGDKSQFNDEAFQYFMSGSPLKSMTPSKLLPPNTPLNQLGYTEGVLSGPAEAGNNSLWMADDDFDCVSALQDLSNSAPPTPSKLLLPSRISQTTAGEAAASLTEELGQPPQPKTSFLSKVKAKVGESQKKT